MDALHSRLLQCPCYKMRIDPPLHMDGYTLLHPIKDSSAGPAPNSEFFLIKTIKQARGAYLAMGLAAM